MTRTAPMADAPRGEPAPPERSRGSRRPGSLGARCRRGRGQRWARRARSGAQASTGCGHARRAPAGHGRAELGSSDHRGDRPPGAAAATAFRRRFSPTSPASSHRTSSTHDRSINPVLLARSPHNRASMPASRGRCTRRRSWPRGRSTALASARLERHYDQDRGLDSCRSV